MTVVDTSDFSRFTTQISARIGLAPWDVMLAEVGKVLDRCVELTTREKVDRIKRSIAFRNRTYRPNKSGPAILYFTKKGIGWFWDEPGPGNENKAKGKRVAGGTFHPMTEFFHYGQDRWQRYQDVVAQLTANQIDVRDVIGRGAQSWVQIGQAIGVQVNAPGYVRDAIPWKGIPHINGRAYSTKTPDGIFVDLVNTAPLLLGTIDGNRILQTAINGRIAYFEQNLRRGVFDQVAQIARAYPSLRIAA
jgi:hypothetical protein